jgi:hypothetical protein
MDFWAVLDLQSTTDIPTIKKAYAAKLKIHHPEDDPEGFQRVRLAYENALKFAQYNKRMIIIAASGQQGQLFRESSDCSQDLVHISPSIALNRDIQSTKEEIINEFIGRVKTLYTDPNLKNDLTQWKHILEDEKYWNLEIKKSLNVCLLNFLANPDVEPRERLSPYQRDSQYRISKNALLPEVWELFNDFFFWTEQERELYKIFPQEFLDFVWEKIHFRREQQERRKLKNIVRRYIPVGKSPFFWIGKIFLAILVILFIKIAGPLGIGMAIVAWCRNKHSAW